MEPGIKSRRALTGAWTLAGAAMIFVPIWYAMTRGASLLAGHPANVGLAVGLATGGVLALAWVIAELITGRRRVRTSRRLSVDRLRRRALGRLLAAVPVLVICLIGVVILAMARPAAPSERALSAMRAGPDASVSVVDKLTWYELTPHEVAAGEGADSPTSAQPVTGLLFFPQGRLDPRAYAPLLQAVAEAGYLVAVVKEPFNSSWFGPGSASTIIRVHPEIERWAVAGHAQDGGTTAARYAAHHRSTIAGLVLLASYPKVALDGDDVRVLSIAAAGDRLVPPKDIVASRRILPPGTDYRVIQGATRSTFADVEDPPDHAEETVDHLSGQQQAITMMITLLAEITPKQK